MSSAFSRAVATFFGAGLLPWAPGTWGALAALPIAWALHVLTGPLGLVLATGVATLAGWWATAAETRDSADQDPSEIVIDEVAGQWVALWPVSLGAAHAGLDPLRLWPGILAAFVLFRAFDILKPGPVGWADRLHTPLGVMLDDVIAGVLAAIGVGALAWVAHGLIGV
jgi:phosphatidylglycerophosphatase A